MPETSVSHSADVSSRPAISQATIEFGVADQPYGPFHHVSSVDQPLKCDPSACNTYFAAWVPRVDPSGAHIWSIGHNRWNGEETSRHLAIYRPTFHPITS